MPVSLVRRPLILACLFVSLVAYFKPLRSFHFSTISRYDQSNHTSQSFLSEHPDPLTVPRSGGKAQLSCPEPTCPPEPLRPSTPPPSNISTSPQTCNCPSASSSTSKSPPAQQSQLPSKLTIEQETIAKLRAEGIIIIFKTGAQEVSQLGIHLGTTLRYLLPSDILFFSDLQGSIGPFIINDALRNVDQLIRDANPDFEIYRRIHEYQSTGQDILELKEDRSRGDDRGGWKLDKYKFIHMVEETFEMRPDAKWYVFIETDSYIVWPNLVAWLSKLDSKKPWYMGSAVWTGAHSFAHGGSGYVLSNAAMNRLLGPNQPQGLARSWDTRMTAHCCGDIALGIALEEKGVKLTGARPFLNGYKPSTFTYGEHWCQPVVSMHHMTSLETSSMWRFERKREIMGIENVTMFSELYEQFVEPYLMEERDNWDNLSHGQEFRQPDGWSENSELEEIRSEEERLRQERQKQVAELLDRVAEEKKLLDEEERKKSEEQKDEGHENDGPVEGESAEAEGRNNVDAIMAAEGFQAEDQGGNQIEKPLIDSDAQNGLENVESKQETASQEYQEGDDRLTESIEDETKSGDSVQEEPQDAQVAAEAEEKKNELKKLKKMQIQNMRGMKKKIESNKVKNEAIEQPVPLADVESVKVVMDTIEQEEPFQDPNTEKPSSDSDDKTESNPEEPSKDSEPKTTPEPDYTPATAKLKRLVKRQEQDSLAEFPAELNTYPKWRAGTPFVPEKEAFKSFENCRKACAADSECFQFTYYDRTCKLSTSFRLGAYKAPEFGVMDGMGMKKDIIFKSGWMMKRIREWTERNACKAPEWPVIEY